MRRLLLIILFLMSWHHLALASNLVLQEWLCIPHATVIAMQDGILSFTYGTAEEVYHLQLSCLEAVSETVPDGFRLISPSEVPEYMQKASYKPVRETSQVRVREIPTTSNNQAWFLFGNLGYSDCAMEAVNRKIQHNNEAFRYFHLSTQPEVGEVLHYNGGIGLWIFNNLALGMELGAMSAYSKGGAEDYGQEIILPALEWGGFVKVGIPFTRTGNMLLTTTLGLNTLSLTGARINNFLTGAGQSDQCMNVSGSALCIKTAIGFEYIFEKVFGIGIDIGYRQAKIENVNGTLNGYNILITDGHNHVLSVDYSGFYFQTGMRIYIQ